MDFKAKICKRKSNSLERSPSISIEPCHYQFPMETLNAFNFATHHNITHVTVIPYFAHPALNQGIESWLKIIVMALKILRN